MEKNILIERGSGGGVTILRPRTLSTQARAKGWWVFQSDRRFCAFAGSAADDDIFQEWIYSDYVEPGEREGVRIVKPPLSHGSFKSPHLKFSTSVGDDILEFDRFVEVILFFQSVFLLPCKFDKTIIPHSFQRYCYYVSACSPSSAAPPFNHCPHLRSAQ